MNIIHHVTGKNIKLHFDLLWHAPYSPDFVSSDFSLSADLKNMSTGKIVESNKELMAETKRWYERIDLERKLC